MRRRLQVQGALAHRFGDVVGGSPERPVVGAVPKMKEGRLSYYLHIDPEPQHGDREVAEACVGKRTRDGEGKGLARRLRPTAGGRYGIELSCMKGRHRLCKDIQIARHPGHREVCVRASGRECFNLPVVRIDTIDAILPCTWNLSGRILKFASTAGMTTTLPRRPRIENALAALQASAIDVLHLVPGSMSSCRCVGYTGRQMQ